MDVSLILLSAASFLAWLSTQKFLAVKNRRNQAKLRLAELLREAEHSRSEHQHAVAQIEKDLAVLQERAVEIEQRLCAVMLLPNGLPIDGQTPTSLPVAAQTPLDEAKPLRQQRKAAAPLAAEKPRASKRGSAGKKVAAPRRRARSAPVLLTDVVEDPAAYMAKMRKETSRADGAAA